MRANTFSCGTGKMPVKAKGGAGYPPHKKLLLLSLGCTQCDRLTTSVADSTPMAARKKAYRPNPDFYSCVYFRPPN
jgi:hypothetical protein